MKLHKVVLSLTASLLISEAHAAGAPVGYIFQPDSQIRANEMNSNFQELADRADAIQTDLNVKHQELSSRIDALELASSSAAEKLYIFTVNSYDGAIGRVTMNDGCRSVDASASFCSLQRIKNAIDTRGIEFQAGFSGGWLDEFPTPTGNLSTACDGWTSRLNIRSGVSLSATGYNSRPTCNTALPVVCCR